MMQAFSLPPSLPPPPEIVPPETVLPGLSPQLVALLTQAAAPDRLALVGGAVRDLLRHRLHNDPWTGLPDLDLVVEGSDDAPVPPMAGPAGPSMGEGVPSGSAPERDVPRSCSESQGLGRAQANLPAAHRLARRLRQRLEPGAMPFYQEHPAYGTVELEVLLPDGALLLDVATARRETYPEPARNPRVRFARLEDDLARRDFTINAMALVLGGAGAEHCEPGVPAGLLDPYGGRDDLRDRQLRFLHPRSVRDDPTRVLRGARYAARMGFELAADSRVQLAETLAAWPWPWRPGDPPGAAPPALGTRLRMELELLLEREAWPRALAALQRWGALMLLDASLQADRHWHRRLRWALRAGLPLLPALLAAAADPVALAERLQLPHRQHRLLVSFVALRRRLQDLAGEADGHGPLWRGWRADQWTALLEEPGHGPEAVALALASAIGPRRPLLRWWLRWRHLDGTLTAAALLAEGLRPGPELGERLRRSRRERLAGERC
jgi:poly(A) polymerase